MRTPSYEDLHFQQKLAMQQHLRSLNMMFGSYIDRPFTYIVADEETLLRTLDPDTTSDSTTVINNPFRTAALPFEGDLAKTLEDYKTNWYIRIDGEWVNIHGTCDGNPQPVIGHISRPGTSTCLSRADHRHGIADAFGFWDTTSFLDTTTGIMRTDTFWSEYPEGTFAFVEGRCYQRCNDEWVCFTHIH